MKKTALKVSVILILAFSVAMLGSCATKADPRVENPSRITIINKDFGVSYVFRIEQRYLEKGFYKEPYIGIVYEDPKMQAAADRSTREAKIDVNFWFERLLTYNGILSDTYSNLFKNNWQTLISYWNISTPREKTYVTVPALQFVILGLEIENGKMSVSEAMRTVSRKPVEVVITESSVQPGSDSVIAIGPWEWTVFNDEANEGTSKINISNMDEVITVYGNIEPYTKKDKAGYVGWNITPDDTTLAKLKTATAISFKIRGDGRTYKIQLPTSDITDGNYYETTFATNRVSETTVTVNISDFARPKGGSSRAFNKQNIQNIQMMTLEGMRRGFRLTISDLTLIQ